MKNKEEMINQLSTEQKNALIKHFDEIYECDALDQHEYKMIWLAWLWANGHIHTLDSGQRVFDEKVAGVPLSDYEITIEDEVSNGINLDVLYHFHGLDRIIDILKW
jgi:hypothetical protein